MCVCMCMYVYVRVCMCMCVYMCVHSIHPPKSKTREILFTALIMNVWKEDFDVTKHTQLMWGAGEEQNLNFSVVQGKFYRTEQLVLQRDPEALTEEEEESHRLPSTPSLFPVTLGRPNCLNSAQLLQGSKSNSRKPKHGWSCPASNMPRPQRAGKKHLSGFSAREGR